MKKQDENYPIDFVITWVDDKDPGWQEEYFKYKGIEGDKRDIRFRDMDLLQFLFRGIERFTPWVNKVYFVTCGQCPEWLNTNYPKLVCVNHEDFIPHQYLPTFSSHAIELNFHRMEGLSEHFVYFNDDMFLTGPLSRDEFFKNGLPCASAVIDYYITEDRPPFLVPVANTSVINSHFKKREVTKKYFHKFYTFKYHKYLIRNIQFYFDQYFPGLKPFHLPGSYLKSTFEEVWQQEPELLDSVCSHKFRVISDVNHWLMEDWQFCNGQFMPRDTNIGYKGMIKTRDDVKKTVSQIESGKYKMMCINDDDAEDFEFLKSQIKQALLKLLPDKSDFER